MPQKVTDEGISGDEVIDNTTGRSCKTCSESLEEIDQQAVRQIRTPNKKPYILLLDNFILYFF